jgi:hypothetical protein
MKHINPELLRKVKIFAVVGIFGLIVVGGLAIWAGVSALNYLVVSANQVVVSPMAQDQIQNVKTKLQHIQFQPLHCWGKAQTLLNVQPWLERPVVDNLKNLKTACLNTKPEVAEGSTI